MAEGSTASTDCAQSSTKQRSKKSKSEAWEHFTKAKDDKTGNDVSICSYCKESLAYNVSNGTSSMWKHLKSCKKYPQNLDKKQKLLGSFSKSGVNRDNEHMLTTWKFNEDYCRHMLARMVIVDEQPFSVVEHEGFWSFVSACQPLFKHVSRYTIARDCMKLYICERTSLRDKLSSLKSRIALTTDIWTSIQNLSYLCLTAHFIDENWNLHKRLLNFVVMPSHKGKDIGKMVEKCIIEWGIRDHISSITVDNASSNDVAVAYLKDKLRSVLVLGGDFFHMRCAAHILNLIVKDGLNEVHESISQIRAAVKYVRSSPTRAQQFQRCIIEEGITHKGSVCLDISTRWNSTYLMLETSLKFRQAFVRLEDDDVAFVNELDCGVPNSQDWDNASMLSLFLKKFYEATIRMSGSLYVTSNYYFHEVISMFSTLTECESHCNSNLREMARKMRGKFDKYYESVERTNMMVLIAVVLDPRYKLRFLKYCCRRIHVDSNNEEEMVRNVMIVLERLFAFYETAHSSMVNQSSSALDESNTQPSLQDIDGIFAFVDPVTLVKDWYNDDKDDMDGDSKSELERYLSSHREPDNETFDLLKWWNDASLTYKVLSLMAKDILAIPVSTVASESTFSTSGRVLDQFRSSLTPKFVEALICAQDWLRSSSNPITIEQYMKDAEKYEEELCGVTTDILAD